MPLLQFLYENRVCPITDTHLLPKIFTLHILPFASQDYFLPRMTFCSQNSSKIFLVTKFPPHKNLLHQNLLPKISSQENLLQKEFDPHFAHQVFIHRICSPNVSFQICSKTFGSKIFALLINSKKNVPIFCSKACLLPQTLC